MSAPLQSRVVPGVSTRTEFPLAPDKTALLVIDIQRYLSDSSSTDGESEKSFLYHTALPSAICNIGKLLSAFRRVRDSNDQPKRAAAAAAAGCEVIFTYLQALTKDGRDISVDYKLSGPLLADIPRVGCTSEELFLPECFPDTQTGAGDILLPKTSCSVFQSTNLDYLLRQLGIEQLVVTGQLTDQCVESAVRDAADLGYFVTVVMDACAATSESNHEKGLHGMKGFCRLVSTGQVLEELDNAKEQQKETPVEEKTGLEMSNEKVLEYLREQCLDDVAEFMTRALEDQQKRKSEQA